MSGPSEHAQAIVDRDKDDLPRFCVMDPVKDGH